MAEASTSCLIASGATTSGAVDLQGYTIVGFDFPVMTSSTVTFTAASPDPTLPGDPGAYHALYDSAGNAITLTTGTGTARYVSVNPGAFGMRWLKIVASGAEGADRTIVVTLRADR